VGRPPTFRPSRLRRPQPVRPIPLTPLCFRHPPASSQRIGRVEIRHSRCLKIVRVGQAGANGSLCDIAPTTAHATKPSTFATPAAISASDTFAPNPTRPRQTARPNDSSRPRCANGPTQDPTRTLNDEPKNFPNGCMPTTGIDPMAASMPKHPSADSASPRTTY